MTGLDRRRFLGAASTIAGAIAAAAALPGLVGCNESAAADSRAEALARAYFGGDDDGGAANVGRAHRVALVQTGQSITEEAERAAFRIEELDGEHAGDDDDVIAALAADVHAELAAGDTARLEGWTCSPTELRLALLVALAG